MANPVKKNPYQGAFDEEERNTNNKNKLQILLAATAIALLVPGALALQGSIHLPYSGAIALTALGTAAALPPAITLFEGLRFWGRVFCCGRFSWNRSR